MRNEVIVGIYVVAVAFAIYHFMLKRKVMNKYDNEMKEILNSEKYKVKSQFD